MITTANQLSYLESIIKKLGYSTQLQLKSDRSPYDILSVNIHLDLFDAESEVDLLYYPRVMDLDNTDLLQFFVQFPYDLSPEEIVLVSQLLPYINSKISLGHMSINFNENKIQYKYIHALPLDTNPEPVHFTDIFQVFYYTPSLFESSFIALLQEKQAMNDIIKKLP